MVRALHVLALSADGHDVLLGPQPDARPSHRLEIDDRLRRVIRGDDPDGAATVAQLSPRDIQARLRAGASVEEVATEAGVPVVRIERYAGPVRSEQEQVVVAARASYLRRSRAGRSTLALADAVAFHLGGAGTARYETAVWSAARSPEGDAVVQLRVRVRGRARLARWRYEASDGEVTALDPYAAQLGYVGVPRPARVPAPVKSAAPRKAAPPKSAPRKVAPGKAALSKAGPAKTATSNAAPGKTAARKGAPAKTATSKAVTSKAVTSKAVTSKAVTSKAVTRTAAPAEAAPVRAARSRPTTTGGRRRTPRRGS